MFLRSIAIVIGPTPPGTGVTHEATCHDPTRLRLRQCPLLACATTRKDARLRCHCDCVTQSAAPLIIDYSFATSFFYVAHLDCAVKIDITDEAVASLLGHILFLVDADIDDDAAGLEPFFFNEYESLDALKEAFKQLKYKHSQSPDIISSGRYESLRRISGAGAVPTQPAVMAKSPETPSIRKRTGKRGRTETPSPQIPMVSPVAARWQDLKAAGWRKIISSTGKSLYLSPELTSENGRARMVVFAFEVGGRWSSESIQFIRLFAKDRAKQEPERLRVKAASAW